MAATSSSRWPRSPSHGKCSKRFCGSSRSYGRSHHQRQHEAFDCHAFKHNRQEKCVQMPVKIARSTPRPSFGLPELLVASHISRLASRDIAKSLLSTLVSESSGDCRFNGPAKLTCCPKNRISAVIDSVSRAVLIIQQDCPLGRRDNEPCKRSGSVGFGDPLEACDQKNTAFGPFAARDQRVGIRLGATQSRPSLRPRTFFSFAAAIGLCAQTCSGRWGKPGHLDP